MTTPLQSIRAAVSDAREAARKDAKRVCRAVRSRGTYISAVKGRDQVPGRTHQDCIEWSGTLKEIDEMAAETQADEVWIGGGFDGSDDSAFLFDHSVDYEPSVESWDVLVWHRVKGYLPPVDEEAKS